MRADRRIRLVALASAGAVGALVFFLVSSAPPAVQFRRFLTERLPRNLAEAATPEGGERLLPAPLPAMLALLRGHGVDSFRPSPRVGAGFQNWLPFVAAAWPIKPDAAAPWFLGFAGEALPAGCREVDRREGMLLARCA
jgi:hypothetical protein